jgi:hypothetical protein
MASATSATTKKRRGRKPRGGIASLNEILTYQEPSEDATAAAAAASVVNTSSSYSSSISPLESLFPIPSMSSSSFEQNHDLNEFHHHNLDIPWHHNETTITPHEFQINHQTQQIMQQQQQPENIPDEELDDLDLFPGDEYVDYETIFKTQTSNSTNKGLHMSARDREHLETYRPQTETHESSTFGTVPEHMRIISITSNSTSVMISTNHFEEERETKETIPDFYHPFRLSFACGTACGGTTANASSTNTSNTANTSHRLEDAISWPSRSHFACWWCKHTFETYPKVVPISIVGDRIEVVGNFCTWNCGKAYCLKEFHRLDMFNTFYYKIFGHSANEIVPSPSYLSLDTFGGPVTIEQYRKCLNNPERSLNFELFAHLHIWVSKMFIRT